MLSGYRVSWHSSWFKSGPNCLSGCCPALFSITEIDWNLPYVRWALLTNVAVILFQLTHKSRDPESFRHIEKGSRSLWKSSVLFRAAMEEAHHCMSHQSKLARRLAFPLHDNLSRVGACWLYVLSWGLLATVLSACPRSQRMLIKVTGNNEKYLTIEIGLCHWSDKANQKSC